MKTVFIYGVDGYIGHALAQRLLRKNYKVIGFDNLYRRTKVHNMGSISAIPIDDIENRTKKLKLMGDYKVNIWDVSRIKESENNYNKILLKKYKPDTVINLAHLPSAPYSMLSQEKSNEVLVNNIIGTNNILWDIKEVDPDIHYITIGTTGEYDHINNIDIEEGYFKIKHNGRQSKEMIFPRRPGSIYHTSKVGSTYLIDFLTRTWNLKCTDIMQAIVFGAYTTDIHETKNYTRLDTDEAFGTVVHRFVMQSILGHNLTLYGEGKHQRGFISLNDSIQALEIAINNPPKKGRVQVWNQLSNWYNIEHIAHLICNIAFEEFKIFVAVKHMHSPRTEFTGEHYYNYKTDVLKSLGYSPTRTIEDEIRYLFNILGNIKYNIEEISKLSNVINPKIKWNKT